MRIFLNYRRDDTAGHAGRLYDALAARFGRDSVFIDIDAIDLGAAYAEVIHDAVTSCDVVIAMIGRNWLAVADDSGRRRLDQPNDFVRLELESALGRDVYVIPACVQGASIPPSDDLPPTLAPLAGRQGFELRDTAWHDDVGRLIRRLERLDGEAGQRAAADAPIQTPRQPRRPTPWRSMRRWLLPLGGLIVLAVAAAVAAAVTLVGDGSRGSGSTTSGDASGADARLLAVIPPITRTTCQGIDYGPETAKASVSCSGARLAVVYHLFPSKDGLDDWYLQQREELQIEPGSGVCTTAHFRGEAADADGSGRHICFVETNGEPNLVFKNNRALVAAEANIYGAKGPRAVASLLRQWRCCLMLEG